MTSISDNTTVYLVLCNAPTRASAEDMAQVLLEQGLAACVNILPAVTSLYRWEGKLTQSEETPMLIKSTAAALPRLQETLVALHPCDVPEIIAWPVTHGLPAYLHWVATETQPTIRGD